MRQIVRVSSNFSTVAASLSMPLLRQRSEMMWLFSISFYYLYMHHVSVVSGHHQVL
jgi:hypothetical protein